MIENQQENNGLSEDIQQSDSNQEVAQEDTAQEQVENESVDELDTVDDLDDVESKEAKSSDKVKKIKRVVRTLDKRNRALEAQNAQQQQVINSFMQAMQQHSQQQFPQQQDYYNNNVPQFDPYTGVPMQQQPDMYEIAKKAAEEQYFKREQEQKTNNFAAVEENLRAKYDDYEDFTSDVRPFLTKEMLLALRELPATSLESLYKAWGSDANEVKKISKLPAFQQYLAIAKLDERYSTKSNPTQGTQPAPSKKVIPPLNVKPSTTVKNDSYVEMVKKMV